MTIRLNLSSTDVGLLMGQLQAAIRRARKELRIELLGPGLLLPDTALVLFDILRSRPGSLSVHVHTWTCLCDGAVLLWLGGDTRTMREDTWIQIPHPPEALAGTGNVLIEESPLETDLRTVLRHMGEWLPVEEVSGRRLFRAELQELGLLEEAGCRDFIAEFFYAGRDSAGKNGSPGNRSRAA